MKNIYLCGFMGCGKTSVAKIISKKLNLNFIDTDFQIQKETNMSISEIFQKQGERWFRNLETEILKNLQQVRGAVISTGGGMLINNPENAKLARAGGMVVFLETPFKICWDRIKNSNRPLIVGKSVNHVKNLYGKRQKKYRRVASAVVVNDRSSLVCAKKLIGLIKRKNML